MAPLLSAQADPTPVPDGLPVEEIPLAAEGIPIAPDTVIADPPADAASLPDAPTVEGPASPPKDSPVNDPDLAPTGQAACSQVRANIRWIYRDETGLGRPMSYATFILWEDDVGPDWKFQTMTADSNGNALSNWFNNDDGAFQGTLDFYAEVWGSNAGVNIGQRASLNVYYSAYTATSNNIDPSSTGCVLYLSYEVTDTAQWRHYMETVWAWKYASAFGSGSPSAVKIYYPDPQPFGPHYEPVFRAIAMPSGYSGNPDTSYHEYGHHVNYWAYGHDSFPPPYANHSLCDDNQATNLAFGEGWANFFAAYVHARTRGGTTYSGNDIENSHCTASGYDNEWNVATALWDLYDAHADGRDLSTYGSDNMNPSTNSIWKVMVGGTDPQNFSSFRTKWLSLGYSSTMFTETSGQNKITW